jgi:hypothetical protein
MNGADKKTGVRKSDPGAMLLQLAEHSMRRYLERKRQSGIAKGQVPPNVQSLLDSRKEAFKPLKFDFIDQERLRTKFTLKGIAGKKVVRMASLDPTEPTCDCGAPEVDEMPCGCILFAAEKKGIDIAGFLDSHDTVETWKSQYAGLPAFKIPGNEVIELLVADELKPLPPVTYPQKPGRPSTARIKGATEQVRKYKKAKAADDGD